MNNARLFSVIFVFAFVASFPSWGQPLQLVTQAEFQASKHAPEPFEAKLAIDPQAPRVEVIAPDIAQDVPIPSAIEVRFKPMAGSSIRPDSFRVQYGALKIDITKRLTSAATVSESGISVKQAALPRGRHTLYISIEDSAGRQGAQKIEFQVN